MVVSVSVLSPLASSSPLVAVEGSSGTMQDQTSNNAIPRIGRRASTSQQNSVAELLSAELERLGKIKRGPPMLSIPEHWKTDKRVSKN